jgi:hypothetical protein
VIEGTATFVAAALGFLGYGIQPTEAAEWGYASEARGDRSSVDAIEGSPASRKSFP